MLRPPRFEMARGRPLVSAAFSPFFECRAAAEVSAPAVPKRAARLCCALAAALPEASAFTNRRQSVLRRLPRIARGINPNKTRNFVQFAQTANCSAPQGGTKFSVLSNSGACALRKSQGGSQLCGAAVRAAALPAVARLPSEKELLRSRKPQRGKGSPPPPPSGGTELKSTAAA